MAGCAAKYLVADLILRLSMESWDMVLLTFITLEVSAVRGLTGFGI